MTTPTHVVLIRGINVGGKNPVPMTRLRAFLEERGFESVRTYIQSGNVVLTAPGATEASVSQAVESALADEFRVATVVLTLAAETVRFAVVDAAWAGKGAVYFRRLSTDRAKSRLSSVMSSPFYKKMTIRNWRTTTTLVGMLNDS